MIDGIRSLTVGREQKVGRVLASAPLDLVDLLFDLQTFEVVELWLVRLELCVELVLTSLFLIECINAGRGLVSEGCT